MKKSVYTLITFAVFAASALATQAQLDLKVPFEFKAGTSVLPAGSYRISEPSPGIILIRGEKGAIFVPRAVLFPDPAQAGRTSVMFTRSGDHYILEHAGADK